MSQNISLISYGARVDQNRVSFNLSVWIGGWGYQGDAASLWAEFYNTNQLILGNVTIAAVDNIARQNISQLLHREVTGMVPINTRWVKVVVYMASTTYWNDASVDNVSFKLSLIP